MPPFWMTMIPLKYPKKLSFQMKHRQQKLLRQGCPKECDSKPIPVETLTIPPSLNSGLAQVENPSEPSPTDDQHWTWEPALNTAAKDISSNIDPKNILEGSHHRAAVI
ncbi:hypothetical protein CROQUDRAFT_101521 [Cronartium quercuum f. sp. fusiforme G11]|uniref:Uncharacterized protein n=1 Tax=Cronartium quercuum f. sp. fusiforme G11 TaxID=708437 RepID=A0A9P6N904_9BASI|nr:hypothetical protein CROQUDRAFT_101521 [Cronartium quercuum f. sp. fusiforme G11]